MSTPKRYPPHKRAQPSKISENRNPNLTATTPSRTPMKTPSVVSEKNKPRKSTPKTPALTKSPAPPSSGSSKKSSRKKPKEEAVDCGSERRDSDDCELEGSSKVRRMKSLMLEEAMGCVPEPGAGRVMHLVKAFERLLSISMEKGEGKNGRVRNWALPGLQPQPQQQQTPPPPRAKETEIGLSPLCACSPEFERESCEQSSIYSIGDSFDGLSWRSSPPECDKKSRSKSTCSSRRSRHKRLKARSPQPFKLRTEQRGRCKEENFLKKVNEMFLEQEKQRIPVAQGIPWTTEYPEFLVKPVVKETTEPVDLVLHSDVRAAERADFDLQVAERMNFHEQIKSERERLQKLEEEEEIKILRKELVPKAQPMPYFDRPFVPKKPKKHRTVANEPRLGICRKRTM